MLKRAYFSLNSGHERACFGMPADSIQGGCLPAMPKYYPCTIAIDVPPGNDGIMRPTQPHTLVEEPDVTIKSDRWIRRMAQEHGMIEPFIDGQVRDGVISYGNSSYGYDMRIANEFKVF